MTAHNPMIPVKHLVILGLLVGHLTACGIFSDHSRDYQRAASIKPISLPPGIKSQPLEPLYGIPRIAEQEINLADTGSGEAPRPDPLSKNTEDAKIKIQRVGERRWILAEAPSSQVWPLTQSYLAGKGMVLGKTQANTGLIETQWLELKDDLGTLNRFRISIEQGIHPDTTEVHVLQQNIPKITVPGQAAWPEQSQNPSREAWLLDDLAKSLADGIANRAASLLGQAVGGDVKAGLMVKDGEPVLRLRVSAERAKASLQRALTAEGYVSWGQNAEHGLYYLGFKDQTNPPGWFRRYFLLEEKTAAASPRYPLEQVLQHLDSASLAQPLWSGVPNLASGEPLKNAAGYLLKLVSNGEEQILYIRNARGEKLSPLEAKKQLSILRRNLL